jgi:hypothetical protein
LNDPAHEFAFRHSFGSRLCPKPFFTNKISKSLSTKHSFSPSGNG